MIEIDFSLKRDNFEVTLSETFGAGITGIYGPSGSGKTSLLNSICGLAKPEKGKIAINNTTVFDAEKRINLPVEKRSIGYVFQEGRLFPHMSVEKNLWYGYKKEKQNLLSFEEVVELLNLSHILKSKPSKISGGERQRTALGRSLLSSPELLLLDEPFSAVDAGLREQILPFLLKIHQTVNIPILVVSHDITDLLKLSNRLCIIKQGRCIGHDDYHNLLKNKQVQNILGTDALINSVNMKVSFVDELNGLTILSSKATENKVSVLCERSNQPYQIGQDIKIFIKPDDIALSSQKIETITMQNQLYGTITDIIEREKVMLCVVDVGFPMLVEITAKSLNRLKIEIGSTTWCLFKSVAIDTAS